MRILITGICGFVGSELALALPKLLPGIEIARISITSFAPAAKPIGCDLSKPACAVIHADVRSAADFESLPSVNWLIDAAANPSVLAGIDGHTSSRQLIEHNLGGTINVLEFCKRHSAGFALISTSRVYSAEALAKIPVRTVCDAFDLNPAGQLPVGCVQSRGSTKPFPLSRRFRFMARASSPRKPSRWNMA